MSSEKDTICAVATPPGKGGVAILRLSGFQAFSIAEIICQRQIKIKEIQKNHFYNEKNEVIDQGLILAFKNPQSFTGEDVIEFHGHGSPMVMDQLIQTAIYYGARIAEPGEFSRRAFLNNKMDLVQAEAIADLINAASHQAAHSAIHSLQGIFSEKINTAVASLIRLRVYVEAAIDFPEEEIDFLSQPEILQGVETCLTQLTEMQSAAKQGSLLRDGMSVVIAGKPNAGKSTLLNQLSGKNTAIVTDIPGTTRDVMREWIHIDGLPLHIIDTAGLRETEDIVEKEGVKRAWDEIQRADIILLLIDYDDWKNKDEMIHSLHSICGGLPLMLICNKIDLQGEKARCETYQDYPVIFLSAKDGEGIDLLKDKLKKQVGYQETGEGIFIARRRHVDAIRRAIASVEQGKVQLIKNKAGELLAEELRLAQKSLSEITGKFSGEEFTADDLLGEIFSSFCIGK